MAARAPGQWLLPWVAAVCAFSPILQGRPSQKPPAPDAAPIIEAFAATGRADYRVASRAEALAFIEAWPVGARQWIDVAGPAERPKRAQAAALSAVVLARTAFDRLAESSQSGLRGQLIEAAHARLRVDQPTEFERRWLYATTGFLLAHGRDAEQTPKHLSQAVSRFPGDGRLTLNQTLLDRDVITLVAEPGTPPSRIAASIGHGDREMMREDPLKRRISGRAATVFTGLLSEPEVGHEAAARLGWLRFHNKAFEDGRTLFERAFSGSSDAYVRNLAAIGLGLTHLAEGRTQEATAAFKDAVVALPTARASVTALAVQLFLAGQRHEAAALLDALAGSPNKLDPWKHVAAADRFLAAQLAQLYADLGIGLPVVTQAPHADEQIAPSRSEDRPVVAGLPIATPQPASGGAAQFSTRTTLVAVDASVMNGRKPVNGLTAGDFELRDNDVRQVIESVSVEGLALDVSVVLDLRDISYAIYSSKEQTFVRDATSQGVRDTGEFSRLLRPDDRLRIITATRDVAEPHPLQGPGGRAVHVVPREMMPAAALYDAVATALMRRTDPDRRHLVLVFTDGVDGASIVTADQLRRAAARSDALVQVFRRDTADEFFERGGAGWAQRMNGYLLHPIDQTVLRTVAEATGGGVEQVRSTGQSVVTDVKRILESFRQRYVLRFTPTGVEAGGWHTLQVTVTRPVKSTVQARRGYFGG